MNATCRRIQDTLADGGPQALRHDEAAQLHLAECPACFAVMEGLAGLNEALERLPAIDAPEATVQRLLEHPALRRSPAPAPVRRRVTLGIPMPRLLLPAAAAAALLLALFIPFAEQSKLPTVPESQRARLDRDELASAGRIDAPDEPAPRAANGRRRETTAGNEPFGNRLDKNADLAAETEEGDRRSEMDAPTAGAGRGRGNERRSNRQIEGAYDPESLELLESRVAGDPPSAGPIDPGNAAQRKAALESTGAGSERAGEQSAVGDDRAAAGSPAGTITHTAESPRLSPDAPADEKPVVGGIGGVLQESITLKDPATKTDRQPFRVGGAIDVPERVKHVAPIYPQAAQNAGTRGVVLVEVRIDEGGNVVEARVTRSIPLLDAAALEAVKQWKYAPTFVDGRAVPIVMTVEVAFPPEPERGAGLQVSSPVRLARSFFEERSQVEGLFFQPARGYWANTYVPGDPALRRLHAQLTEHDQAASRALLDRRLLLHDASQRIVQPFDPSPSAAIAVHLASDRSATRGPRRALVQVGLRAAPRHAGHRSAMRVAIVLDARGRVPPELMAPVRGLLAAFARARYAGDRFNLVVAGRDLVLPAEQFRFGTLSVALRDLLESDAAVPAGLDLERALRAAIRQVSDVGGPQGPLGSTTVMLVTGQPLGEATNALERLASRSAAAGITVSAIGVGRDVEAGDLDRIVLAGHGRRAWLQTPDEAAALVDRELSAASRVVARAVRLRIRLAAGVKLVEVVGSRRLDSARVARVRREEHALDLQLARNLGIESDRGDDEDGIQIVIPGFYAGDSHAILLDVVTSGPGPLADVTVRYKDLVHLRNGTARASLGLDAGSDRSGPLQVNVLKNFLAHRLSASLERASRLIARGRPSDARVALADARALLVGVRAGPGGLTADPDVARDVAMLDEYLTLLDSGTVRTAEALRHWSQSLRYAGFLKILPRPAG